MNDTLNTTPKTKFDFRALAFYCGLGAAWALVLLLLVLFFKHDSVTWSKMSGMGQKIIYVVGWVAWVAAVAIWIAGYYKSVWATMTKRSFAYGAGSMLFTTVVIIIAILFYMLMVREHATFDLTKDKRHSLSPQTIDILKKLEQKVKIYVLYRDGAEGGDKVKKLVEEFRFHTRNLSYQFVDPKKDMDVAQRFGIREYETIVVQSGMEGNVKRKDVYARDIFLPGRSRGEPGSFAGERALIQAILTVTGKAKKVYFLDGHLERGIENLKPTGYSELATGLKNDNYVVERLELMKTGRVPSDCNVLVIADPRADINSYELKELQRYMLDGGHMMINLEPMPVKETPNLVALLKNWGIVLDDDFVLDPKSSYGYLMMRRIEYPIPQYNHHDITKSLIEARRPAVFPLARSVEVEKDVYEKIRGTNPTYRVRASLIMETTPEGWAERDLSLLQRNPDTDKKEKAIQFDEGKDRKGPIGLGVVAERALTAGQKEKAVEAARLVAIGDADFASNAWRQDNPGNMDLALNCIAWLAKEKSKVNIRAKKVSVNRGYVSPDRQRVIFYGTVVLLPLGIIAAGIFVYFKRRNL